MQTDSALPLLGEGQLMLNDENAVEALLGLLHNPEGLSPKAQQFYRQINQQLCTYPILIWPMLIRAEGWLQSRKKMREKWGGKRPGAGRPPGRAKDE
ncbi:hypothetical protein [Pseudomonas sp. ATCC 13867]|uniref:hypothetical protein n=1 Tax=Pseudomonas sp. ATCC 13867 TaxID=1294143 RepID=UPI00059FF39A|nr:hypothetical protein [Pseudomonas sp. ATCC 13867]RFQ22364.1 hypothetical protein D0N87_23490 [Pseudomonas sp. ATCC 13867]